MGRVKTRWLMVVFTSAAITLLLGLGSLLVQTTIADKARAETAEILVTVRDTTHLAVKLLFQDQVTAARAWADDPQIKAAAHTLLTLPRQPSVLLESPAQHALRSWYRHIQVGANYRGYFIVSPDNINLASSRNINVGTVSLLMSQRGFLADIWQGKAAVSLPLRSDVPLANSRGELVHHSPSMFVAAPIRDDTGATIALFMLRLDPGVIFTNVLKQGRIGTSGETYAFDLEALLISHSRFDEQLQQTQMLHAGEAGIFNIQLRDPGVNLITGETTSVPRDERPLTRMAESAVRGEKGVNVTGYRDYRGVPVVGAWVWDNELGLGFATELDVQEAYQTLTLTQWGITIFSLLALFLFYGFIVIYVLYHQRRTAEYLALSEKKQSQLFFNTVETMIIALDCQGRVTSINRKGCEMLGYTANELIGKNWFTTCLPKALQQEVSDIFKAIFEGDLSASKHHENDVLTHSGERRCIAWHNTFITDRHGQITGALCAGDDITESKQAQEALRESEKRFRLLVEGIGQEYLIYRRGYDGVFYYTSPAIEYFSGKTTKQAMGLKWWELFEVTPTTREKLEGFLNALVLGEVIETSEVSYMHPDKSIRTLEITERPETADHGESLAVLGIARDITERKKSEEELGRSAVVFEKTDEGIIIADANGEIIMVNKAFTDISGFSAKEVQGKNPRFQQSGRHDKAFYRSLWRCLETSGQWRGEIWNRRKNGEIYPAWENINIVKDDSGRIINYVAIFSDISVLKESELKMAHLAHHDNLTGLANRLRFMANLEQAVEVAKRHRHKVALLFLDLDKFKQVNDTLGHNAGDELLKIIARRLTDCVRSEDTVARLGGDEFTVLLAEISQAEDAGLIAREIVRSVSKPAELNGETVEISASVGISIYPDDHTDCEELVKAADGAMYQAKAKGKDCYQFFTAELASRLAEKVLIEKDLQRALARDEFELNYQPQIRLDNGKIAGVEALIRWNHPDKGQLLPAHFIQVADDANLIDDISEWVIRTAIRDYQCWSKNSSHDPRIAVNITGRQMTKERSIEHILAVVQELSLGSGILQLDFEVTETALKNTEGTNEIIEKLRQRGVMFAIDDFGTGYSSLSRLKQMPVDLIKIDRSFIRDIDREGDDRAIAAAIIALAHSLDVRVVGEGVETRSQLDVLRTLGCDEIQGFYFCKPIPAAEIGRLLDKTFE